AKTGGIASNGSGDYVIAMSVCPGNLINESESFYSPKLLNNDSMSPLFLATIEATSEALWNSLFMATTIKGVNGRVVEPIPVETVLKLIR
ncbi:MAG: P1 family peptidase, partial [Bacteroidales bacterium]